MGYLMDMFRATEEANRQTIIEMLGGCYAESLLDLGCGDGSFTVRLGESRATTNLYGVEIDQARASEARTKGVKVEEADLNDPLPYPDNTFDIVHANQVLEHVHDTDQFISEARRVSRRTVILSTNNLSSWHNIISLALGFQPPPMHVSGKVIVGNPVDPLWGTAHPTEGDAHLRLFTMRAFRELCEYHGLRVADLRGVGYYPLRGRPARIAEKMDRRHAAFLVARLTATPRES